jgi:phosphatidate cytidylyltransferase
VLGKDRLITAAVALPLLAAAVIGLPPWALAVLLGGVAAVGQWELYRMYFGAAPLPAAAWLACVAGCAVVAAAPFGAAPTALGGGVLLVLMTRLLSPRPLENAIGEGAVAVLGLAYVAFLLSAVAALRARPDGIHCVFYLLLVTWAGDAAAYYVGSRFGSRRLTEVSPGKTVEGTAGGLVAAVAAAYLGWALVPFPSGWGPLGIGLLLGVLAVLGDLVESLFKRAAGVKDSSHLIPAHGGVLDKVDSFLFTGPALLYYLSVFGPAVPAT